MKPEHPKKFKELQAEWYQKLAESGFQDIEDADQNLKLTTLIRSNQSHKGPRANDLYNSEQLRAQQNELYYTLARSLMLTDKYKQMILKKPKWDIIWQMHCDGKTMPLICQAHQYRYYTVKQVIQRFKVLVLRGEAVIPDESSDEPDSGEGV